MLDVNDDRLDAAVEMGASTTVNTNRATTADAVMDHTGGAVHAVLDFANSGETAELSFAILAKGGHQVRVGLLGGEARIPTALSFTEADDVVARANASPYGLGASVWSGDQKVARDIARRIGSGVVWVNDVQVLMPQFPMGGHRQSGIGRENGVAGLHEYTNTRTLFERKARGA